MVALVNEPCVCVESPFGGDVALNVQYADACMYDSFTRGEAPFLGHLLYTRVLDDALSPDRTRGVNAHLAWLRRSDYVAVYVDLGVSPGMQLAIDLAAKLGLPCPRRTLGEGWQQSVKPGTAGFFVRTRGIEPT
jgi:hypothetical protein